MMLESTMSTYGQPMCSKVKHCLWCECICLTRGGNRMTKKTCRPLQLPIRFGSPRRVRHSNRCAVGGLDGWFIMPIWKTNCALFWRFPPPTVGFCFPVTCMKYSVRLVTWHPAMISDKEVISLAAVSCSSSCIQCVCYFSGTVSVCRVLLDIHNG